MVEVMPFSKLEAAIDSPPPLIGDSLSQVVKNEVPLFCQGKPKIGTPEPNLPKNNSPKASNESVLSRCTGRPTIQSFMNHISTLYARKQQMEHQKQQQFHLFMQQGQHMLARQQLARNQDAKSPPFSHQQPTPNGNPFLQQQKQTTLNPFTQQAVPISLQNPTEQKKTNAGVETKVPKVRKVMKGGVLVSMPINARHTPGGTGGGQPPRGEGGSVLNDKTAGLARGNILDDILARSQENKEKVVVTRKKAVIAKTGKLPFSQKAEETAHTHEQQKAQNIGEESSNGGNINAEKAEVTANVKKSARAKEILASVECKLQEGSFESNEFSGPKSEVKKQCKIKPIVISDSNSKQYHINERKPEDKPDLFDRCTDDNANQSKKDIDPELQSTHSCYTVKQNKVEDMSMQSTNDNQQDSTSINPVLRLLPPDGDGQINSSPGQGNDLHESKTPGSNNGEEQFESDISHELGLQSPRSLSGDLVTDMESDSDNELNTTPSQRTKKRQRYSSLTSESSSEALQVSSFDWIRNLSQKLGDAESIEQESTNSPQQPKQDSSQTVANDVQIKSNDRQDHFLTTTKSHPVISNKKINEDEMKSRDVGKTQTENENKDTRMNENLKTKEYDEETQESNEAIVTRSMLNIDLDLSHGYNNESRTSGPSTSSQTRSMRPELRGNNGKRSFGDSQGKRKAQTRGTYVEGVQEQSYKKEGKPSTRRSSYSKHETRGQKHETRRQKHETKKQQHETRRQQHETRGQQHKTRRQQHETRRQQHETRRQRYDTSNNPREQEIHFSGGKSTHNSAQMKPVVCDQDSHGSSSLERQQGNVVIANEVDDVPSLLSMVSTESVVDVTVAQQELSDQRTKTKTRGGNKKKKKKKPTEWFLRQLKMERERRERTQQPREQVLQREIPACVHYAAGKCAKGATCPFKHKKIKELCRYHMNRGCEKNLDGMCPKMHEDFPCMFYHGRYCSSGDSCKYSHAPLTEETREILNKHLTEIEKRKQAESHQDSAINPMQENSETSVSIGPTFATNSNPRCSQINPTITGGSFSVPNSGVGMNPSLITRALVKPKVDAPKVKRLCSLSTYKPQLLSSVVASIGKLTESQSEDNKTDTDSSPDKGFVPGMFKER